MSKFFKIIFITFLFCFIALIANLSFAENSTPIDTQAQPTSANSSIQNPTNGNATHNSGSNSTNSQSSQPSARITSLSESNLQFANILNIILIVIGTLLILLAIAILIRLKR